MDCASCAIISCISRSRFPPRAWSARANPPGPLGPPDAALSREPPGAGEPQRGEEPSCAEDRYRYVQIDKDKVK